VGEEEGVEVMAPIRIDFRPAFQHERDITLLCMAFGHTDDPITNAIMLPRGEHAQDMFDEEVNAAFERLTPNQQAAVLRGQFQLRTGTKLRVADPVGDAFDDKWHEDNRHLWDPRT
jgi:hypothetical protein